MRPSSEIHLASAPRVELVTRAIAWAVTAFHAHDIAVSALSDVLGVV